MKQLDSETSSVIFNPIINNASSKMVEYAKCCKVTLVIVLNPILSIRYENLRIISNFTEEIQNMHVRKGWYEIQCLNHPLKCVKVHQHVLLFTFLFVYSKTKSFLSFKKKQIFLENFRLTRTYCISSICTKQYW